MWRLNVHALISLCGSHLVCSVRMYLTMLYILMKLDLLSSVLERRTIAKELPSTLRSDGVGSAT